MDLFFYFSITPVFVNTTSNSTGATGLDSLSNTLAYETATRLLVTILAPLLLVLGSTGNILVIIVLRKGALPGVASTLSFTWLAVVDMVVLWASLPDLVLTMHGVSYRDASAVACCATHYAIYSSVSISAWSIVFITVQRVICVVFPFHYKRVATKRSTIAGLLTITILLLATNAHMFWSLGLVFTPTDAAPSTDQHRKLKCGIVPEYEYFFNKIYSWMDLTLASLAPGLIMVIGNILIIQKVVMNRRKRRSLHVSVQHDNNVNGLSAVLIAITCIFIVCTLPVTVFGVGNFGINVERQWALYQLILAIVNLFQYISNSTNIAMYVLTSSIFRRKLLEVVCCRRGKPSKPSKPKTSSSSSGVIAMVTEITHM